MSNGLHARDESNQAPTCSAPPPPVRSRNQPARRSPSWLTQAAARRQREGTTQNTRASRSSCRGGNAIDHPREFARREPDSSRKRPALRGRTPFAKNWNLFAVAFAWNRSPKVSEISGMLPFTRRGRYAAPINCLPACEVWREAQRTEKAPRDAWELDYAAQSSELSRSGCNLNFCCKGVAPPLEHSCWITTEEW